ncbi:MAG: hypothetical protein ABFD89_18480 [Bryobacteraceae bacterium]
MSQGNNYIPTTGVFSGLTAANDMNAALDALLTANSGSSAPTNALGGVPKLGQTWLDTTSATFPVLKRYTGSAWVVEAVIDVANGIWIPVVGSGVGTIASATTTDIGSQPQHVLNVTGTTTITGLGSTAVVGQEKVLIFGGALTLTYNSTSLIIPTQTSKVTAAGDIAIAVYLGSGNWRVLTYVPITGAGITSIDSQTGAVTTSNGITSTGASIQLTAARRTLPTKQVFTSGSGTYTTPANVLWIRVRMVGGGGGGGGGNNSASATAGGTSTFSGGSLSAGGGSPASGVSGPTLGGSSSGGNVVNIPGGGGGGSSGATNGPGGQGGASYFGGGGGGGAGGSSGQAASSNSGGGGGGGGGGATASIAGGGAAGGYVEHIIQSPAATYTYAVGAGGNGAAGTSAGSGGAGAAGIVIVEEYYN